MPTCVRSAKVVGTVYSICFRSPRRTAARSRLRRGPSPTRCTPVAVQAVEHVEQVDLDSAAVAPRRKRLRTSGRAG